MAGVVGMRDKLLKSPARIEAFRASIRIGLIRNRLAKHILGEIELSTTQLQAAKILLDKTVPNVSAVEITGKDGAPIEVNQVSDIELARRIAFSLEVAGRAIEKARQKESA